MAGVGTVPSDEELESVTLQAYRDLNKGSTQSITKSEFTKWILEFASGTGAPPAREVTLQNALEQFRVVPPNTEAKEDNNFSSSLQDGNEVKDAQPHDEVVKADELHSDAPPQQEQAEFPSENAAKLAAEHEHELIDQSVGLPKPAEPEFVTTEAHEHSTCDDDILFNGDELTPKETETQDTALIDGGDQGKLDALQSQADEYVDQAGEAQEMTLEDESEQQIASGPYEPGIDAVDYSEVTANAESDYHPFVADTHEAPQEAEPLLSEELHAEETKATCSDIEENAANNDSNLETQNIDSGAASEELASQKPEAATGLDDHLLYEQEEFAQETSRTESTDVDVDAADVSPLGESAEDTPVAPEAEVFEPATTEGEAEVTNVQNVVEEGTEADETPAFVAVPHQEPAEVVFTAENTETGEEGKELIDLDHFSTN